MKTQTVKIYVVQFGDKNIFKIGISSDPNRRLADMQTSNPYLLSIIYIAEFKDRERAQTMEHLFHNWFKGAQMYGEWFEVDSVAIVEAWEHVSKALTALGASIPDLKKVGDLNIKKVKSYNFSDPKRLSQNEVSKWAAKNENQIQEILKDSQHLGKRKTAQKIAIAMGFTPSHYKTVERVLGDRLK